MKRLAPSGSLIVTGPASRSKIANEYNVSRLGRTMPCWTGGASSRPWRNFPKPPFLCGVLRADRLSGRPSRLGIPLPTLSRRIRELEQQLKVQFLERSARGANLTDAGTRLYEHAGRGIEVLLEAEQAVMSDQAR